MKTITRTSPVIALQMTGTAMRGLEARHGSFWKELDAEGRIELINLGRWRSYGQGEAIYHEGGTDSDVVILQQGFVKITSSSAAGQQALLDIRAPGTLLGETEALQRGGTTIRRVTAEALDTDVVGLHVDAKTFKGFLNTHPVAWESLSRELSNRLSDLETRVGGMAMEAANRRLAQALSSLLDHDQVVRDGTSPVMIKLSQADLAAWIGTSRETVERTLRSWRERGIVSTGYRQITVLRPADLFRIAGRNRPLTSATVPSVPKQAEPRPRTAAPSTTLNNRRSA